MKKTNEKIIRICIDEKENILYYETKKLNEEQYKIYNNLNGN